ncbi:MAG: response regulator [Nitrospinae bacterium]|nr:response regulator [Nitrospinota bacterium]
MSDNETKNNPFDDLWDQEDIDRFLADAGAQVDELQRTVDRLDSDAPDYAREDILMAFGIIHTIKGVAGFMGYDRLNRFLHSIEHFGEKVKKSDYRAFSAKAVEGLDGALDIVRKYLNQIREKGSCGEVDGEEAIVDLFGKLAETEHAEPEEQAPAAPPDAVVTASPVSEIVPIAPEIPAVIAPAPVEMQTHAVAKPPAKRTALDDDTVREVVGDFVVEAQQSLDDIEVLLRDIHEKPDEDLFRKMFGTAHTLKGASAMVETMGVPEAGLIKDVTHLLEGLLTGFRQGSVRFGEHSSPVLDESFQMIRQLVVALGDVSVPMPDPAGVAGRLREAVEGKPQEPVETPPVAEVAPVVEAVPAASPVAVSAEPVAAVPPPQPAEEKMVAAAAPAPVEKKEAAEPAPKADAGAHKKAKSGRMSRIPEEVLDDLERRASLLVLLKNRFMAELEGGGATIPVGVVRLLKELDAQVGTLNDVVSKTRLQPLKELFDRYHLPIREIARKLNKKINLKITGAETEIDKQVGELINEPLIHIIRNAADHGIEPVDRRRAAGKSETGTVHIDAARHGSMVVITISDDGAGLNAEKIKRKAVEKGLITADMAATMDDLDAYQLVFEPGFSTADQITDISGRGVGMDYVKRVVTDFRGTVTVDSTLGRGSSVVISLPLKSSVLQTLLVRSLPKEHPHSVIAALEEVLVEKIDRISTGEIERLHGREFYRYSANAKSSVLPVLRLRQMWGFEEPDEAECTILVIKAGLHSMVLVVDEVLGSTDLVIKPLPMLEGIHKVPGVDAASILGDGGMAFVLDIEYLLAQVKQNLGKGDEVVQKPADPEKRLVLLGKYDGITYAVNMQNIYRGDIHTAKRTEINGGYAVYRGKTVPVVFLKDVIGLDEPPAEEYNMIPFLYLRKEMLFLLAISHREGFLSIPFSLLETSMANANIEFNFPDGTGGQVGIVRYDAIERRVPGYVEEHDTAGTVEDDGGGELPKVLCVDDDVTFQHQITAIVRKLGGTPIIVGNGLEGIDTLKEQPDIGLVLMDIEMPVMDGFKAMGIINGLKEQKRLSGRVRVYILSDRQDEKTRNYCLKELHSDGYLVKSKTADHEELMTLLQDYILANGNAGGGMVNLNRELPKILSVDDAASIQHLMRKMIKKAGGTPIIAKDNGEAVKAMEMHPDIKAVFLDIEMPGKSGYETIGDLKKINPDVPVYMLTDRGQEDIREYCLKMGADGFLLKRDGNELLMETICQHTGKKMAAATA